MQEYDGRDPSSGGTERIKPETFAVCEKKADIHTDFKTSGGFSVIARFWHWSDPFWYCEFLEAEV